MFVTQFDVPTAANASPLTCITHDWFGQVVRSATAFGFAIDPGFFHFRVRRAAGACLHPDARPGAFTPNLWQHDAAEFFLVHPDGGRYLEFNLAANGAWWSCEFTAPRQRVRPDDDPFPAVVTSGKVDDDRWEATASLPLGALRDRLRFGSSSRLNATFTLLDPDPVFLSAAPLGPGPPDFHQPARLPQVELQTA